MENPAASDWPSGPHRFQATVVLGVGVVREPIRVVAVIDESDRCGFAYRTRSGHPVSGEEAFIVHRDSAGTVRFTLRSLTMRAEGGRALALPLFLLIQRRFRRRYLRVLLAGPGTP